MQYLKYIGLGIGAFFIFGGLADGEPATILLGILIIGAVYFTKIKDTTSDVLSSRAQDDLLKLKSLLDKGVITEEEYSKKATKLKEKI